jgi:glycosyltransferase involved in cell wall biosynthesis
MIIKSNLMFVIHSLSGGGAERVMINLLKHLDRTKYRLTLALLNPGGEYFSDLPDDVELTKLRDYRGKRFFFHRIFDLRKAIRLHKPDLIVSFMTGSNISLTRTKLFGGMNFPLIIREGNNPSLNIRKNISNLWLSYKKIELRLLYRTANRIISISEGIKTDLSSNWGINEHKIITIPNPIIFKEIKTKSAESISEPFSIPNDNRPTIIAVGRLVKQKGYEYMLRAFQLVRAVTPARLIILGKGDLQSDLQDSINRLGMENDVTLLGFAQNPFAYLNRSKVYLSTSLWEGFHLTIAEAMACGVPPVATDCDFGPREIIQDRVNGFLVPVGNIEKIAEKVIELLTDDDLRTKISENAKARALDFDISKIVKEYEKVFDQVIAQSNS